MKLTLKGKIIGTNILLLFITFLIVSVVVIKGLDTANTQMVVNSLIHQADICVTSIKQELLTGDSPSDNSQELENRAKDFALRLSSETGMRVMIFTNEKTLSADSNRSEYADINFTELDNVLEGNRTYVIRQEQKSRFIYFAFPIMQQNIVLGEVILVYPMGNIDKQALNVQTYLMISFVLGLFIILIISLFLTSKITKPVVRLKKHAEKISSGDYSQRMPVRGTDEVSELSAAFNRMSEEIQIRIDIINSEKQKLNNTLDELYRMQEKQKQFISNISHELKTPMTTIIGYVDLLKTKQTPEVFKKSINYLESAGERLLRLVEDLIDLSLLTRSEFEIEPEQIDLSELVRDIAGQMSLKANKFDIEIETSLPQTCLIYADPVRIKQALVNILDNAIKYSHGGKIIITVTIIGHFIHIKIQDTGIGIPEGMLQKIFEPFQRVDKARSRKLGGTGLGLAIVKEIVTRHGGSIDIQSCEGKGTTVTLSLPMII
jgi:signal transduction histidine kinase